MRRFFRFFPFALLCAFFCAASPVPTVDSRFASDGGDWQAELAQPGDYRWNVVHPAAEDGRVGRLVLSGSSGGGKPESPHGPNQIRRNGRFSYGRYRFRMKPASCKVQEEVASAAFLYANDGRSDRNGNGIVDNDEIDVEILCGEPTSLYLTSWTDYGSQDGSADRLIKVTRKIDFKTGAYWQTPKDGESAYDLGERPLGHLASAKFPQTWLTGSYVDAGFEWASDKLRFFVFVEGKEITLWTITNRRLIPHPPVDFLFNLWHPRGHWSRKEAAAYPQADAVLTIDSFRYWER